MSAADSPSRREDAFTEHPPRAGFCKVYHLDALYCLSKCSTNPSGSLLSLPQELRGALRCAMHSRALYKSVSGADFFSPCIKLLPAMRQASRPVSPAASCLHRAQPAEPCPVRTAPGAAGAGDQGKSQQLPVASPPPQL